MSTPHDAPFNQTITIGLAQMHDEEAMVDAIRRADKAFYAGKAAGRDRYVFPMRPDRLYVVGYIQDSQKKGGFETPVITLEADEYDD